MAGPPITALNEGLLAFANAVKADMLAKRRVEVAVVTFADKVEVEQHFVTVDSFQPPTLYAAGRTALGTAVLAALKLLDARKEEYRANGVAYYRPWFFLITDGAPQGESAILFDEAAQAVRKLEHERKLAFFSVAVDGADMAKLAELSSRSPQRLNGLKFTELFLWLSRSVQAVSHSRIDDEIRLQPRDDWAKL
jgi:uncharacterized protein YegL